MCSCLFRWRLLAREPQIPEDRHESNGQWSGFSVPRWARPPGDSDGRSGRQAGLRRKLLWMAAALLLLYAAWGSYSFAPNSLIALFRQPLGNASAMFGPGWWALHGGNPQGTNFLAPAVVPQGIIDRVIQVGTGVRSAARPWPGTLYIGGQSRVVAFNVDTGRQIWGRPISGPAHGVPAVTKNALYLGTLNKRIIGPRPRQRAGVVGI